MFQVFLDLLSHKLLGINKLDDNLYIAQYKDRLRSEFLNKRKSIKNVDSHPKSKKIIDNLLLQKFFINSQKIALYSAVNNEISTERIFYKSKELNKNVYYPKVTRNDLVFYNIKDLNELKAKYRNIPEPNIVDYNLVEDRPDLIIVPGPCFDENGNRLGYGKGFYDRYLSDFPRQNIVGLAYDFQILDNVPSTRSDVKVGYIITESRVINCMGSNSGGNNND